MNIPLSGPDITKKEIDAVVEVLRTRHLSRGPKLGLFENMMAKYVGAKYAVAANSGTSALHLAVRALGIGEDDYVVTTPFSFIASSNSVLFERALPAFVDVEPETFQINPSLVEAKVAELKQKNLPVKAILAVDIFGYIADWDALRTIAKKYDLVLIEDSCEALGSTYKKGSKKIKAGTFGDVGIFGFYPNKQITTGEGGMLVTNNKAVADMARSLKNHGLPPGKGWSDYERLGFNYHISDINCAVGIAQLARINELIKKRTKVANLYNKHLSGTEDIILPPKQDNVEVSRFVYVVLLAKGNGAKDRNKLVKLLATKGISAREYFPAIHLSPFYRKEFGYKRGDFPITESISERSLALPYFNNLTEKEVKYVAENLKVALKKI